MLRKSIRNIYIHIPFCQKKCSYCDFPVYALGSSTQPDLQQHQKLLKQQYIDSLNQEIDYFMNKHQQSLDKDNCLQTIYFGGGTPSLISPQQLGSLIDTIKKYTKIQNGDVDGNGIEMTMEIDPGTFDSQKLDEFQALGANRLSMGVQTLNEQEFKALGRGHQFKDIMKAVDQIHKSKFANNQVSIDLMMGLPIQTLESYYQSLKQSLNFDFGHQSFYMLTLEQNTPFFKKYQNDKNPLPITDELASMYQLTHSFLESNSFQHYEVSNFAKNQSLYSKHNLMYWEGDQEYLAFGCGAASYYQGRRFTRPKTLMKYYQYVEKLIKGEPLIEQNCDVDTINDIVQTMIMCQLRKSDGLNKSKLQEYLMNPLDFNNLVDEIRSKYGTLATKYFKRLDYDNISLHPVEGFLVSNTIISDILLIFEDLINNKKQQFFQPLHS